MADEVSDYQRYLDWCDENGRDAGDDASAAAWEYREKLRSIHFMATGFARGR